MYYNQGCGLQCPLCKYTYMLPGTARSGQAEALLTFKLELVLLKESPTDSQK